MSVDNRMKRKTNEFEDELYGHIQRLTSPVPEARKGVNRNFVDSMSGIFGTSSPNRVS